MSSRQVIQYYSKDSLKYSSFYPDIDPNKDLEDVGFYLTIANRNGDRPQDNFQSINTYTLGISFQCPTDRVLFISATNALVRQGYMLCSPMIIEPRNNEEVKIDLFKFSDKDDLILPFHKGLRVTVLPACYHHIKKIRSGTLVIEHVKKEDTTTESDFF